MAILTTIAVVGGISVGIGYIGSLLQYFATEDDRARARIDELNAENKQLNAVKDYLLNLRNKIDDAKEHVDAAITDFNSGGHIMGDYNDNEYTQSTEFTYVTSRLTTANAYATRLIDDINATISSNNQKIQNEQNKLN